MRRLTIVLTDEEYAALEARAEADRRTPKQMAERLVTQPPLVLQPPILPVGQPWNPIWPPTVWSGTLATSGDDITLTTGRGLSVPFTAMSLADV
jgi:hypothetical protein